MISIFILLLFLCSAILIWQFVGYPFFMGLITIRSKTKAMDTSFLPKVSILVPTYNEIGVIENRIKNLFALEYKNSNYEIIVVDSGSTDGTSEVVEAIIKETNDDCPSLRLIREKERNGKASAINLGKNHSEYDIVLVTDANATFNENVLRKLMPHFKNPKIGAVGGRYCVENSTNSLTESESFYWDLEFLMRSGESLIDSACLFHGEINAWRKDLVNADVNALSEDLDMCIKIRNKGYKIAYESKAAVFEPSAINVTDQIKQRKRTTIGTIQNVFKHWKYLLLPKDLYSGYIFLSHKTLQIISPFLFLAILFFYILLLDLNIIIIHVISTFIIFFVLLFSLIIIKSKLLVNKDKSKFSLQSILKLSYYVILNEYIVLLAWKDFIFGKYSVLWEKVATTR